MIHDQFLLNLLVCILEGNVEGKVDLAALAATLSPTPDQVNSAVSSGRSCRTSRRDCRVSGLLRARSTG